MVMVMAGVLNVILIVGGAATGFFVGLGGGRKDFPRYKTRTG